jgi:DNA-binding NarL/FixJ family response regulator
MTRVLIGDDHDVIRTGLHCEVVAEAADGEEAILKAIETKADIAAIDYSMPLINGIEVTRRIRAQQPKTEALIFTMHDSELVIQELLQASARGSINSPLVGGPGQ